MPRRGDGSAPGAGSVAARARRGHISRPGDRVRGGTRLQAGLDTSPHPENPGGRPGSRLAVPLGSRCRLFSAASRQPGAGSPLTAGQGGLGAFLPPELGLPGAGRQLQPPALSPLPGLSSCAARPARPGRRLLFPLSPRPRVLGRSPWRVWGQGDTPGSQDSPPAPLPKEDSLPLLYPFPLRHKHLNAAESTG